MPGVKFNSLTVVHKSERKGVSGRSYYACACDCGKMTTASRSDLVNGKTKSCGCLRRVNASRLFKTGPGDASFNSLYGFCQRGARTRQLEFTITKEQHRSIVTQPCYYCGSPPPPYNLYITRKKVKAGYSAVVEEAWVNAHGVDRKNPEQGYVFGNCVACCAQCNYAKLDYTEEQFIAHCRAVIAHQDSK